MVGLREAASLVKQHSSLAIGGWSLVNKPSAFVRELVRNRTGGLTLYSNVASYDADILVGAGLVATAYLSHVSFEYLGLAPHFRKAAENGEVEVVDCDSSLLQEVNTVI